MLQLSRERCADLPVGTSQESNDPRPRQLEIRSIGRARYLISSLGCFDPFLSGPKERIIEDRASDIGVFRSWIGRQSSNHHLEGCARSCSVLIAKCFPDHRQRKRRELDEVASSGNVVEWSFQFEQEGSPELKADKWCFPTGLPEIDLIRGCLPSQSRLGEGNIGIDK